MRRLAVAAALALVCGIHASCIDPTHDSSVAALGPEVAGVPEGPTHRPGQPCVLCHGAIGPGEPEIVVGGTIYETKGDPKPAPDITVTLTDAKGTQRTTTTNSVGNFYVLKSAWEPVFPLSVGITNSQGANAEMESKIMRDGSCATCHRNAGDQHHMPAVFLRR